MRKKESTNYLNEEKINASCGMAYALNLIGGRWKPAILWQLVLNGTSRYNHLRRSLPDISERVLVSQLRELEEDLLIKRIVYPEVPPRVEYQLTDLGLSMRPLLEGISQWGDMHRELSGK
jgi:DNA-binding HxlR family transcriptional regulator